MINAMARYPHECRSLRLFIKKLNIIIRNALARDGRDRVSADSPSHESRLVGIGHAMMNLQKMP
ncbi:MAG: hypothetical protein A2X86_21780 [Bdellovibrionales bacterium GWA2_49_15]|nr:MAG: hypothetical protein A2X86_21780 [Bdellovibrionales bacterium GWA2_49_15]